MWVVHRFSDFEVVRLILTPRLTLLIASLVIGWVIGIMGSVILAKNLADDAHRRFSVEAYRPSDNTSNPEAPATSIPNARRDF